MEGRHMQASQNTKPGLIANTVHLVFIACTATLPGGATVTISRAFAVAVCRSAAVVVSCLRCRRLLVLAGQCVWRHEGRRPQERHRQSAAALLQRILQVELPVVREHLQGAAAGLRITLCCAGHIRSRGEEVVISNPIEQILPLDQLSNIHEPEKLEAGCVETYRPTGRSGQTARWMTHASHHGCQRLPARAAACMSFGETTQTYGATTGGPSVGSATRGTPLRRVTSETKSQISHLLLL